MGSTSRPSGSHEPGDPDQATPARLTSMPGRRTRRRSCTRSVWATWIWSMSSSKARTWEPHSTVRRARGFAGSYHYRASVEAPALAGDSSLLRMPVPRRQLTLPSPVAMTQTVDGRRHPLLLRRILSEIQPSSALPAYGRAPPACRTGRRNAPHRETAPYESTRSILARRPLVDPTGHRLPPK